jgi:hypothetical protein
VAIYLSYHLSAQHEAMRAFVEAKLVSWLEASQRRSPRLTVMT